MDQGCSFEAENMSGDADIFDCNEDSSSQNDEDFVFNSESRRPSRTANCHGQIILRRNKFGRPFVQ